VTSTDIRTLLDYHYWALDRMLDAVAAVSNDDFTAARGSSFSSMRDTLAHTYFAEWAWYSRWRGQSPTNMPALNQFADVDALRRAWKELEEQLRHFIGPMSDDDLQQVKEYRLFSGATGRTPLWQMVQHVVNHASYHRGQVTTMLRQAGAEPAKSMDLIAFYRERAAGRG
jgi:uncharacterized damage-inducible protein DinB